MKFKNNALSLIERMFDDKSKFHSKINDIFIKYTISKSKDKDNQVSLPGNRPKILENDITKYSTILNQHYVLESPSYQVIDSNTFSIMFLDKLEPGIEVTDAFVKSIIDNKVDYYLKFERSPKDISIINLRNYLQVSQIKQRNLEEELKHSKNNERIIKDLEVTSRNVEIISSHLNALQNSHFSNMIDTSIGFKIHHKKIDPNSIKNQINTFTSLIRQFGHSLKHFSHFQNFYTFDYVHGTDEPYYKYYVSPDNLSIGALQPFIYANFVPNNAPIMGNYAANNIPLTLDIWDLPNQNGAIIGISGSGKSVTSKVITTRNLIMKNRRIIIIDPQREYLYTTKMVGGEYIDVLASSNENAMSINIFDKANYESESVNSFDLKINDIITFLSFASASISTMEGGQSIERPLEADPIYYQFTFDLIKNFYKKFGIVSLEDISSENVPTLGDFMDYVRDIKSTLEIEKKFAFVDYSITEKDINYNNYMKAFQLISNACDVLESNEYNIFKGKTKINLSNKYVVFNTKDLTSRMSVLSTYVIMNYVIKTMSSDISEQKILLIDEGWKLLSMLGSDYIKVIAKTARKFNLGLIITTQQLEDFENEQGRALLENSSFVYIFKQKEVTRNKDKLMTDFTLNDEDLAYLQGAGPGQGILTFGSEKYKIKFLITPEESKFSESNVSKLKEIIPNEIIETKKKINEITTTIHSKLELNLGTTYEENLLEYYRNLQNALQDIKDKLQNESGSLGIDEENIEDFVLNDVGIYNIDTSGKKIFGPGIGVDEIKYLIEKLGYHEYKLNGELTKVFGQDVFYIKTSVKPEQIFIYSKFLYNRIKEKYYKFLIGDPAVEHDSIILQVKVPKELGKYYVYYPKNDNAQIMETKNKDVMISLPPQRYDFFKGENIDSNYIYVYDMINNKKMVFLENQFNIAKDKILYDTKRVYIRIAYDYFMPFSKEEIMFGETSEFYYMILTDELFKTFVGPGGKVPSEYYKYDQSDDLLSRIFTR